MSNQLIGIDQGMATLQIEVPFESLEPYLKDASSRLAEKVKFEGFRPGKAPYDIVKQRLGEAAIYEEAADRIVGKAFAEAVKEHKLVTVGPPEITLEKLAPGNPLIFKAKVGLLPNVTKLAYDTINTKRVPVEVTPADIEKALKDIQRMRAKETAVDRPAKMGDRLEINFRIFLDDVPVDGGQAEKYPVRLGDNQLIPGFEEQLVEMKTGEEKTFPLTFPKDNQNKQLAGKPVEVKAKVNQIFDVELPALDDEFAKSLGAFSNLSEIQTKLEENLKTEREEEANSTFELALLDEILSTATFDPIPEVLLHVETNRMIRELEQDIVRRGLKWTDYLQHLKKTEDELRTELNPTAEKRIKSALILRTIAEQEKFEIPEEELKAEVESQIEVATARGVLNDKMSSEDYRDSVRGHLRNKKVIDLLKSRSESK